MITLMLILPGTRRSQSGRDTGLRLAPDTPGAEPGDLLSYHLMRALESVHRQDTSRAR